MVAFASAGRGLSSKHAMGGVLPMPARSMPAFRSARVQTTALFQTKSKGDTKSVKAQQFKVGLTEETSKTVTLGFTKENELFVGRLAMVGFAASLIGEIITGQGALAQFGVETGIPIQDVDWLVLGLIGFNLVAALLPASGKFVPQEDALEGREPGALQDPKISLLQPGKFFGVKGFGFTKENELFVGRVAQLGFAFSLIGEAITGKGILGQVGLETGIPIAEAEPLLLAFIAFTLFAAVNEGTGQFTKEE